MHQRLRHRPGAPGRLHRAIVAEDELLDDGAGDDALGLAEVGDVVGPKRAVYKAKSAQCGQAKVSSTDGAARRTQPCPCVAQWGGASFSSKG